MKIEPTQIFIKIFYYIRKMTVKYLYLLNRVIKHIDYEKVLWLAVLGMALTAPAQVKKHKSNAKNKKVTVVEKKKVVYQVFTRLFGNTNTTNKPWGTIAENGVGKFNDFTDKALTEIKNWELLTYGILEFRIMLW